MLAALAVTLFLSSTAPVGDGPTVPSTARPLDEDLSTPAPREQTWTVLSTLGGAGYGMAGYVAFASVDTTASESLALGKLYTGLAITGLVGAAAGYLLRDVVNEGGFVARLLCGLGDVLFVLDLAFAAVVPLAQGL